MVLTTTNITELQEVARLSGNIRSGHDWSADGTRLYLPGDIGSDSIWMVQMNQTELAPLILPTDDVPLIVRARPGTNQVLYGSDEGRPAFT